MNEPNGCANGKIFRSSAMNAVVRMYMVVVVVYSRQTESSNSNSPLNDSCPKSIFHPTRLSYIFMSQQNVIIKHKDVLLLFVIKLLSNINPTITYTRTTRHRCQDFSSSTFVCVCVCAFANGGRHFQAVPENIPHWDELCFAFFLHLAFK